MSRKISLKKLAHMVEGSNDVSPAVRSTSAKKGVIISDKRPWEEIPEIMPTKKGKATSNAK